MDSSHFLLPLPNEYHLPINGTHHQWQCSTSLLAGGPISRYIREPPAGQDYWHSWFSGLSYSECRILLISEEPAWLMSPPAVKTGLLGTAGSVD
jgi:hypothetical protein